MKMKKLTNKSDKQTFMRALLTGDRKTVVSYTNPRLVPPGCEPPLFWDRDENGNYVADPFCLTPAEFAELRTRCKCFPSDE